MRNPLSIEAFADWCEKKPADETYDAGDTHACALAQYARSIGFPHGMGNGCGTGIYMRRFFGDWRQVTFLPSKNNLGTPLSKPHTFGALAKRLREASRAQND